MPRKPGVNHRNITKTIGNKQTVEGKLPSLKQQAPKPDGSKLAKNPAGAPPTPDKWIQRSPSALRPIRMSGNMRNKR